MCRQAEALKGKYPDFDLGTQLKNDRFVRLTHPLVGLSVEEAYERLQGLPPQTSRPVEAGISGQSAAVTRFSWRTASAAQREAQKKAIREAAARGAKVYPGK